MITTRTGEGPTVAAASPLALDYLVRISSARSSADEKAFSTFRAQLALAGYALSRTDGADGQRSYFAARRPLVYELRTLEEVSRLVQKIWSGR